MPNNNSPFQNLLDYWEPPNNVKEPIGCIATTFTFDSSFFEEQCLTRFVKMESNPDSDGAVYLLEREEKFASLKCASVLVDANHCKGKRSLRWDLMPFRSNGGILHAKISLIHWVNYVRIIIGSANLTEEGYRKNQEVFGVVDFYESSDSPYELLTETLKYLKGLVTQNEYRTHSPSTDRFMDFIDLVEQNSKKWKTETNFKKSKDIGIYPVFGNEKSEDVLTQIKNIWSKHTKSSPKWAYVTSPFFNPPEAENVPAKKIWNILNQKGIAEVYYDIISEGNKAKPEVVILKAPESLIFEPPNRPDTNLTIRVINEKVKTRGKFEELRPIHRKAIFLENDQWYLHLVGSSNFTSAGLGVGKNNNYEANLVYVVNASKNILGGEYIADSYIDGEIIEDYIKLQWEPIIDEDESIVDLIPMLHKAFKSATLNYFEDKYIIDLVVDRESMPKLFSIYDESEKVELYNSDKWNTDGKPKNIKLQYKIERPPSGLFVIWNDNKVYVWWPINILNSTVLPPPEKLKDLTLEDLIEIISSSKPTYKSLRNRLSRKVKQINKNNSVDIIDPHKRVNTSSFLLQRTRKFSYALNSIKEKLEKPIYTSETLEWKIFGPVGVKVLYKAILDTAKSSEEKAFLLAETALELSRLKPQINKETIKLSEFNSVIKIIIEEINAEVNNLQVYSNLALKKYIHKVFSEVHK